MEINVESVIDEIKAEIKEKGYVSDIISFNEVTSISVGGGSDISGLSELDGAVRYLNSSYFVPDSVPVSGNIIVRFIKRIIRKFTRFYVKPIVMSQNEINGFTARAFNDIYEYIKSNDSVSELENKIKVIDLKIKTVTKENEALLARIEELEKEKAETK